jgi:hypothetical protein
MVFQSFNLWFHLTVLESVVEAPIYVQKRPKKEVIAEAEEGPPEKVLGFAGLSVAKEWKKVRVPPRVHTRHGTPPIRPANSMDLILM